MIRAFHAVSTRIRVDFPLIILYSDITRMRVNLADTKARRMKWENHGMLIL